VPHLTIVQAVTISHSSIFDSLRYLFLRFITSLFLRGSITLITILLLLVLIALLLLYASTLNSFTTTFRRFLLLLSYAAETIAFGLICLFHPFFILYCYATIPKSTEYIRLHSGCYSIVSRVLVSYFRANLACGVFL